MFILHKSNNCTQRGLLNLDEQANYAALFFTPIAFSAVTKLRAKIWSFPLGTGFIYSNLCPRAELEDAGSQAALQLPRGDTHEGYLCRLPFLSRRAHLPATTPAPAPAPADRGVTMGCWPTHEPKTALLLTAGSSCGAPFPLFSCWLPHPGGSGVCGQGGQQSLPCPSCPARPRLCRAPSHHCRSSAGTNRFQTLCLQWGAGTF